jgi:hypothetical protein
MWTTSDDEHYHMTRNCNGRLYEAKAIRLYDAMFNDDRTPCPNCIGGIDKSKFGRRE